MSIVDEISERIRKDGGGYTAVRPKIREALEKLSKNSIAHGEKTWADTIKRNMPDIEKHNNFHELVGTGSDKVCIIVGASPALKKNVKYLKDIEGEYRDNFILIAVNSVAEFLMQNDVKPDIIISVDCDEEVWTRDLSKVNGEGINLLCSTFSHRSTIENWKGNLVFIPMGCPDESVQKEVCRVCGMSRPIPGCGNSFNEAVFIATEVLQCRTFILVGNELSWQKDGKYYVDGKHSNDEVNDDIRRVPWIDVFGKEVITTTGHWIFKVWLEDLISRFPGTFINATEGGILGVSREDGLLPFVKQYYLKSAIAHCKAAMEAGKDWQQAEIAKYSLAWEEGYDHAGTFPTKYIEDLKIKTILEVGCGNGSGVKELVEDGYDAYGCDIVDSVVEKWDGVADRCTMAFAHNIPCEDKAFDLVATDILEHIPLDKISDSIAEMKRVSKYQHFHVDCMPADWKIRRCLEPHLTIRPPQWWRKELRRRGLKILKTPTRKTFITTSKEN